MDFPKKLQQRLEKREQQNALRALSTVNFPIDFYSNDYIGFARSKEIFDDTHEFLTRQQTFTNGSTGSRLISGNHPIYSQAETFISNFHESEAALIFNSGYDANVGFFSCAPQREDVIFYDELAHASIRDGIGLSRAKSFKFAHNDVEELELMIKRLAAERSRGVTYIVTESVFSMDGDSPNLERLCEISKRHNCLLIIDEAHALGVFGESGKGLVQQLGLQHEFFARLVTFGKGLGCHGSAVLCSNKLRDYLINFSRSLIYTTALPPHSVATILNAYKHLQTTVNVYRLNEIISHFNREKNRLSLKPMFVYSKSAIQCAIIPGNEKAKQVASKLQHKGFGVKAILSPTVPEGQERLRICLHSYNSENEVSELLEYLHKLLF